MDNLIINRTITTPQITLDVSGKIEFSGVCTPEDVNIIMDKVYTWIEEYSKINPEKLDVNFKFEYFNTITSRHIFQIIMKLKELSKNGTIVTFNWFYEVDDEDMKDIGQEFEFTTKLNFNYIQID